MSAEAAEVELAASARPSRRAARLPWAAVALAAAFATASRVLFPETQDRLSVESVAWVAIVVVMAALGALVASYEPRNPISWILCGLPLGVGLIGFAEGYLEKVGAAGGARSGSTTGPGSRSSWSRSPSCRCTSPTGDFRRDAGGSCRGARGSAS